MALGGFSGNGRTRRWWDLVPSTELLLCCSLLILDSPDSPPPGALSRSTSRQPIRRGASREGGPGGRPKRRSGETNCPSSVTATSDFRPRIASRESRVPVPGGVRKEKGETKKKKNDCTLEYVLAGIPTPEHTTKIQTRGLGRGEEDPPSALSGNQNVQCKQY